MSNTEDTLKIIFVPLSVVFAISIAQGRNQKGEPHNPPCFASGTASSFDKLLIIHQVSM
jgi:hypothetical protein